jgi:hypothetical protein
MSALGFTDRLVDGASRVLGPRLASRLHLEGGDPRQRRRGQRCVPIAQPGSPFTFITDCPPGTLCRDGYTEFCCVINAGLNACPTNSFPWGWWRADYSVFCNGTRYYFDCNDYFGGGPCRCGSGATTARRTTGGSWGPWESLPGVSVAPVRGATAA